MKRLICLLLVLIFSIFLSACASEPILFTLSVQIEGEGRTSPPEGTHVYQEGMEVGLEVEPDEGYIFAGWEGEVKEDEDIFKILMDRDKSVKAKFVKAEKMDRQIIALKEPVSISTAFGTSFNNLIIPDSLEAKLEYDTISELNIDWHKGDYNSTTPDTYTIYGDIVLDENIVNPENLKASIDVTVKQKDDPEYQIVLTAKNDGEVFKKPEKEYYVEGENVKLEAVPEKGSIFSYWSKDLDSMENPVILEVDQDMEIEAVFSEYYSPDLSVSGEGEIIKRSSEDEMIEDSIIKLEAISGKGWSFSHWEGDLKGSSNPAEVEMERDMKVKAVFQLFAGGEGTEDDPFLIKSPDHLNHVRNYLDKHFLQTADIDLFEYEWIPIGAYYRRGYDFNEAFKGSYDGNGYEIKNLVIDKPDNLSSTGLFAFTDSSAEFKNIKLTGVEVFGNEKTGGLIGYNYASLTGCNVQGNIEGTDYVGGLVGDNRESTIEESYVVGKVVGVEDVGGLVGYNLDSSIEYSFHRGSVTGDEYTGGLIGRNSYDGLIYNSYTEGEISGTLFVGGLVGSNYYGSVTDSYTDGKVKAEQNVGGLAGINFDGSISDSYNLADVKGETCVGGLIGWNRRVFQGIITDSHSDGNVTGREYVGGLIGRNMQGNISQSHVTGDVTGDTLDEHEDIKYTGGLIGASRGGTIRKSYSEGDVIGSSYVGGLIASNERSSIYRSYAVGDIEGYKILGGLVGYNIGSIEESYSAGYIKGEKGVGGLVGKDIRGTIEKSYFNSENLEQFENDFGIPLSTEEMKRQNSYENWDFENTWLFIQNEDYPVFQQE